MIRFLCLGDWSARQVSTQWTTNARRLVPEVESAIENAWVEATARPGVHLFDGPMCRLESWRANASDLSLRLSQSTYKAFLGTNMSHPEFVQTYGFDVMANPVGVSTTLLTSDQRLLLGHRNTSVAYYPGRVHPFAGSLEPKDTDVFTGVARELGEELSMEPGNLKSLRCTGLVEDASLHQPELIFAAESSLSSGQIEARLDRTEHTAIWSVPATGVAIQEVVITDQKLTPVAIASLLLWGRQRLGAEWFNDAARQQKDDY